MTERSMPQTTESEQICEQLLALHLHVKTHECSVCRQLLHKLANSIQVNVFGRKMAENAKPLFHQRRCRLR